MEQRKEDMDDPSGSTLVETLPRAHDAPDRGDAPAAKPVLIQCRDGPPSTKRVFARAKRGHPTPVRNAQPVLIALTMGMQSHPRSLRVGD
jgi:hypothetical protein